MRKSFWVVVILSWLPWILGAAAAPEIFELLRTHDFSAEKIMVVDDVGAKIDNYKPGVLIGKIDGRNSILLNDSSGEPVVTICVVKHPQLGEVPLFIFKANGKTSYLAPDSTGAMKLRTVAN
jgi:hypothetical protein